MVLENNSMPVSIWGTWVTKIECEPATCYTHKTVEDAKWVFDSWWNHIVRICVYEHLLATAFLPWRVVCMWGLGGCVCAYVSENVFFAVNCRPLSSSIHFLPSSSFLFFPTDTSTRLIIIDPYSLWNLRQRSFRCLNDILLFSFQFGSVLFRCIRSKC